MQQRFRRRRHREQLASSGLSAIQAVSTMYIRTPTQTDLFNWLVIPFLPAEQSLLLCVCIPIILFRLTLLFLPWLALVAATALRLGLLRRFPGPLLLLVLTVVEDGLRPFLRLFSRLAPLLRQLLRFPTVLLFTLALYILC